MARWQENGPRVESGHSKHHKALLAFVSASLQRVENSNEDILIAAYSLFSTAEHSARRTAKSDSR